LAIRLPNHCLLACGFAYRKANHCLLACHFDI